MAIEFRDNGTVSVDIGGETYTLRRPKMGELWEFYDYRDELSESAQAQIQEMARQAAELDEESEEFRDLIRQIKDRRLSWRLMSEPWLRRAFEELGSKPLPENLDDAPPELTSLKLASQILEFWRDVPLARSPRRM